MEVVGREDHDGVDVGALEQLVDVADGAHGVAQDGAGVGTAALGGVGHDGHDRSLARTVGVPGHGAARAEAEDADAQVGTRRRGHAITSNRGPAASARQGCGASSSTSTISLLPACSNGAGT